MLKKRKNYKILIGIMIGILLSGPFVYAATTYIGNGADLTYSNTKSGLSSTNVQDALDELYNKDRCPSDYICIKKKNTLALGDYVSYTPTESYYTFSSNLGTHDEYVAISPQKMNLWRVIRLNTDGTVEIIGLGRSEGSMFCMGGDIGYRYLIDNLNEAARHYENSTYTIGSRHFGYNGQTDMILGSLGVFNCSTGESCNPDESEGGGDTLYKTDYDLVNNALGGVPSNCWIASRHYYRNNSTSIWSARYTSSPYGAVAEDNLYYSSGTNREICYSLLPIVILKSGLKYDGVGTEDSPMEIIG